MCLGRRARRGDGGTWLVRATQTKAKGDLAWYRRLGYYYAVGWSVGFIRLVRIMSAARTAVQGDGLTATYCVSRRSFRLPIQTPPKPASRPLSSFYQDSWRKSAACASSSHPSGRPESLPLLLSNSWQLAVGSGSPVETCLCRQTAHAELSPRRTPPLPKQSIAAPDRQYGSAWRLVARQADRVAEKDIEPKRGRRHRRP